MGRAQSRMKPKSVDLPIIHTSFKSSGGEVMEHTDRGISMPFLYYPYAYIHRF